MKKKVLFVDSNLNTGGAERIFCTLVRNIDREKYDPEVVILCKPGEMSKFLPDDVKVTYFNCRRSRYSIWKMAFYLRRSRPDAVFAVSYNAIMSVTATRRFCPKSMHVSVRHCLMPSQMLREGFIKRPSSNRIKKFFRRRINWLKGRIDCVLAENKYMEKELIEICGYSRDRVKTVINPLDEKLISEQISEPFNLPSGQVNVVAAGRIMREKGFDMLIEAFAKVVERDASFNLYIIGSDSGGHQAALEKRIEEIGIAGNIHFEGFQHNPYKYYMASDLFVLSSRWEASPNVAFENLYLGKPIVATDCSPILYDIIGSNGRIVPFGDIEQMAQAILDYKEYSKEKKVYSDLDLTYRVILGEA